MYDVAVIGNPFYNSISTPDFDTGGRILSGPAIRISQVIAKMDIHEMVTIGAIGNDFKDQFMVDLDLLGIPEYYSIDSSATGGFHISCDDSGTPTLTLLSSAKPLRIRDIPDEFLDSKYIVAAPGYKEIDSELVEWISDSSDATIVLDCQGLGLKAEDKGAIHISPDLNQITQAMQYSHIIRMERSLWRAVTEETDPLLAVEHLVENGADIGIAMVSSMGAVIYNGDEFYIVPLEKTNRRNILGASDAFLGAFIAGMVRQESMIDVSALASSAASIVMGTSCAEFTLDPEDMQRRQKALLERIVVK